MFESLERHWTWDVPEFAIAALSTVIGIALLFGTVLNALFVYSSHPMLLLFALPELALAVVFLGIGYVLGYRFVPGRDTHVVDAAENTRLWRSVQRGLAVVVTVFAGIIVIQTVQSIQFLTKVGAEGAFITALQGLAIAFVLLGIAYVLSRRSIPETA